MSNFFNLNLLKVPAFYINLEKDLEKRESMEQLLEGLGFENINRFSGTEHQIKKTGVAISHNALLHELKGIQTPFIIFEDDLVVNKFISEIPVPKDADALYLGSSLFGLYSGKGQLKVSAEKYGEGIYRIYNMLAAHAILYLNNNYVEFLARATEFSIKAGTNQDMARAETMKYWNVYGVESPLFSQSGRHLQFTNSNLQKAAKSGIEGAYK
jgi:hypothetical protein